MSMSFWAAIMAQTQEIQSLSASGDWERIAALTEQLEKDLHLFFDKEVSKLSPEEQAQVKTEGQTVMQVLAESVKLAQKQKQKTAAETGKMAQGRKGIAAYKKV